MGVLSYALELIRARSEVASRQRALEQQQAISKALRCALNERNEELELTRAHRDELALRVEAAERELDTLKAPPAAQRVEREPIELLTRGHEKSWIPTEGELRVWEHAYPLITVRYELRRFAAWLQAHPDRAPSLEGMKAAAGRRLMQANAKARPKGANNG